MPDFEAMGRQVAAIAGQLPAGAGPADLALPEVGPGRFTVDRRQVRRWGIDAGDIPADAIVQFRAPSLRMRRAWPSLPN